MTWQPADFYVVTEEGDVTCTLCPLRCRLRDGEAGACQVRRRRGGAVETLTRSTTVTHWDQVERKPFYHFRPGTKVLTLAPPGCTFRCSYCVNHRLSQYGRDGGIELATESVDIPATVESAAREGAAVGLSYSEPSLAAELTLELAERAGPLGVPVVWKSNGFLSVEAARRLAPALSAVNIDVKAVEEEPHRQLTGVSLAPVLDTVRRLYEAGVWVEVSTPLIPGTSADDGQLERIAGFLAALDRDIPWHLLRLTPTFKMADHLPTGPGRLAAARAIGHSAGLRYVYVERALGEKGRATHCSACGWPVVTRKVWGLDDSTGVEGGACRRCGTVVAGVWR
ncbi:AmmeMemoRadiSam system radical SAM enzyme [Streptomyces sp. NPDC004069]